MVRSVDVFAPTGRGTYIGVAPLLRPPVIIDHAHLQSYLRRETLLRVVEVGVKYLAYF